jgi:DNA end-binding protein Ku
MARAIWSGSISFGLLNVPVKLYSAVSRKQVSFRELRSEDKSRIRHRRVAEADGEEVPYEEIVKGYEIAPEQYVVFSRDELEELDPKKTKAIEIEDFVDLDEIDPIYFDHPYYLAPDKGAERAYALLVKAMNDERKVAVARFVLRNREHLAAIRPMGDVLTLTTMRFADEIVRPEELDGIVPEDGEKPRKKELDMAKQLVSSLAGDFEPDKYRDEYREELLSMIEAKARGEEIVEAVSEEAKPTRAPDLMAVLEESLAVVKGEPLGDSGKPSGAKSGDGAKGRKAPAKSSRSKSGAKSKSRSRGKAKAAK